MLAQILFPCDLVWFIEHLITFTSSNGFSFWQSTFAILGYGPEEKSTVVKLTYNYGVTEYDKGDAYAQVDRSSPFLFSILF